MKAMTPFLRWLAYQPVAILSDWYRKRVLKQILFKDAIDPSWKLGKGAFDAPDGLLDLRD